MLLFQEQGYDIVITAIRRRFITVHAKTSEKKRREEHQGKLPEEAA